MKHVSLLILAVAMFCLCSFYGFAAAAEKAAEAEFKAHCDVCHPKGGNIMNPQKTLHKKDLEANNVRTVADIVGKMRNPGPGMTKFDAKTIPDREAKMIANYILKTFK